MEEKSIKNKFKELYGGEPLMVRSPGRINLIGEHTDYNDGFVLPAAIDKEMILAVAKNSTGSCRLYSFDYQEPAEYMLDELKPVEKGWANYVLGVADQLQKAGYEIGGFDCVFGGDIPIGAGLSSSAALECGTVFALNSLFGLGVDKVSMAKFAQKAEQTFAGVQCGIMDQFASIMGKENHALCLDCRSLDFSYFPISLQNYHIILFDTQVKHSLASSEYNIRRKECEEGVKVVQANFPEVRSLRDVNMPMLESVKAKLSAEVFNRCSYIIEENERLLRGCELLEKGDIKGFGEKMYGSHHGLSEKYEVSCQELDFLVNYTKDYSGVVGARMMGGGFGGCTINLVEDNGKEAFIRGISAAYKEEYGVELTTYEVAVTDGTGIVEEGKENYKPEEISG